MQRSGGVDQRCGLFADKFARRRSLPDRSPHYPTYAAVQRQADTGKKTTQEPSASEHGVSHRSSCYRRVGNTALKPSKRPLSSSSSCGKTRLASLSQLRQQSLPSGLSKSKSASNAAAAGSAVANRTQLQSKSTRQPVTKLISGPGLQTTVYVRRNREHNWQQSIPSKSSPKQPLLEKRHVGITSQKCVRRSSVHRKSLSNDCLREEGGGNPAARRTAPCRSEVEITHIQFDLDKLPKFESRRSSSSTACSSEADDRITVHEAGKPTSIASYKSCEGTSKTCVKKSIEVRIPTSSSCDGANKARSSCSDSSSEGLPSGAMATGSVSTATRRKLTDSFAGGERGKDGRCKPRLSLDDGYSSCKKKGRKSSSGIKNSISLTGAEGACSYQDCAGESEADALSVDLGRALDLRQSHSDCFTVDTSFSECDYVNNERGFSDDGEEDWDKVGGAYEEELTDLDTDDESIPMSEHDLDQSRSSTQQPIKTCVQQELHFNERFLEVKGAGFTYPEQQDEYSANDKSSVLEKTELEIVSEIERRRLRDFSSHLDPGDNLRLLENDLSREKGSTACQRKNKSKPSYVASSSGQESKFRERVCATDGVCQSSKDGRACATAVVTRTHGEASAISDSLLGASPRGNGQPSPALTPSIFPECFQPTIHFPMPDENYVPLPKEQRALLKWKMSSITPNVVKNCIARAGFTKCTRGSAWLGYWGRHMKASSFRSVKEHQKVNHFPGTFQIGRKDRLWRSLSRLQARVGKRDCDFVPQTFVLPQDMRQLKKQWDEGGPKQKWILKPPAAARGIGIRLAHKWSQIPKKKPVIVQRYLSDPFLINGSKFDLRVYVYVSSYDPLVIYVFREGLTRFATCKYSSAMKNLSNKFMHLTNYSINKHNSEFTPNTDETVCQGHKWGLLALWRYMSSQLGIDTERVWSSITELVVKTIISSEPFVSSNVKAFVRNRHSVHELFGFDIMLDRHLKPWLIEVNISPSLHSNSQLDVNIKGRMVRDLFNITGFYLPTKAQIDGEEPFVHRTLSPNERLKHSQFVQKNLPKVERRKILDALTADDIHILMLFEDQLSRCGHFERVYPTATSERYRKYFEMEKYYNILLGEWASKYEKCPRKGMLLLQSLSGQLSLDSAAR